MINIKIVNAIDSFRIFLSIVEIICHLLPFILASQFFSITYFFYLPYSFNWAVFVHFIF